MAMNATQVTLNVKGVNKTGKVFKEIAATAARVGKTAALVGGAVFGGAAAAFAATAKSLGHLSDVAMQAGTSADEITRLSSAMGVLGIKSQTPEMLAMAFQKMTKAVGETGVSGFKKTIAAIAEMETAEERSAEAMRVFGDAGLHFMPLIEAAKDGTAALDDVMAGMPGISDAAANAGDAVADAMQIMGDGSKALWAEAVGSIAKMADEHFAGGIREAAMKANAYVEYYVTMFWRSCVATFENIQKAYTALSADWGNTFSQVFKFLWGSFKSFGKFLWEEIKNIGAVVRDFLKEVWSGLNGDGFSWKRVVQNANFAEVGKKFVEEMRGNMSKINIFDGVQWSEVEMGDAVQKLETKLQAATKAAVAVSSAAVATVAKESAENTTDKVREAVKSVKNDFIQAGSYRAASMSLRADYGKDADKTVKAVNAVKAVNEKIAAAAEKVANNMPIIKGAV
jgi:hypothetical protein